MMSIPNFRKSRQLDNHFYLPHRRPLEPVRPEVVPCISLSFHDHFAPLRDQSRFHI